jgi:hypothetical protein
VFALPGFAGGQTYRGKSVRQWADQLVSPDADQRRDAAARLAELGQGARAAVPELARALRNDPETFVRYFASQALGKAGPLPDPVVAALLRTALGDSSVDVRREAGEALVKLLDQELRRGRGAKLAAGLSSRNAGLRLMAARDLGALRPEPAWAKGLLTALAKDTNDRVRDAALEELGPAGAEIVLREDLRDFNTKVRRTTVRLLGKRKDLDPEMFGALRTVARADELPGIREEALAALAVGDTPVAQDCFRESLKDKSARIRLLAAHGLGQCKDLDPGASAALLAVAAADPDPLARAEALLTLGGRSRPPEGAAEALERAAAGKDQAARTAARLAQARRGGPEGLIRVAKEMARLARDRERDHLYYALSRLGPDGVPALQALFEDGSAEDRLAVVLALASHDPPVKEGSLILAEAENEDGEPETGWSSRILDEALKKRRIPKLEVPALTAWAATVGRARQSQREGDRDETRKTGGDLLAAYMLFVVNTSSEVETRRVEEWWKDNRARCRELFDALSQGGKRRPDGEALLLGMLYAVGHMGPAAAEASVRALLDHPNPFVRGRAAWALHRIQ